MLLESLRAWLNGRREYFPGVAIYSQYNPDKNLLNVLKEGPNEFRTKRLLEELLAAYEQLKQVPQDSTEKPQEAKPKISLTENKIAETPEEYSSKTPQNIPDAKPVNEELYQACKLEADNQYKKVMNTRAILFKKAAADGFLDVNKPDLVFDRGELAIEVVQGWQKVSELYDRAEYVKRHGRLPTMTGDDDNETDYDHIPDELVKQRLDNARKAFNKLKAKDPTPERIALMQKHEKNIKKLLEKWHSLQPKQ